MVAVLDRAGVIFAACLMSFAGFFEAGASVAALEAAQPTATSIELKETTCKGEFVVAIDVGHDKQNSGALSARGRPEFELNLILARKIQQYLVERDFKATKLIVVDGGPDSMKQRIKLANDASPGLLISIHHDSVQPSYLTPWIYEGRNLNFSDRFSGYSLFISKRNRFPTESLRFAALLADELLIRHLEFSPHHSEDIPGEQHRLVDSQRGIYQYDNLIILHSTKSPAVLFEAGIIVNRADELVLASEDRHRLVAEAITDAILKYCRGR
jgi:N-acetylmuramoyl-L-alanine amidase